MTDSCSRSHLFFFQAEDGIRDADVTGVQTCALPISHLRPARRKQAAGLRCPQEAAAKQTPATTLPGFSYSRDVPGREEVSHSRKCRIADETFLAVAALAALRRHCAEAQFVSARFRRRSIRRFPARQ